MRFFKKPRVASGNGLRVNWLAGSPITSLFFRHKLCAATCAIQYANSAPLALNRNRSGCTIGRILLQPAILRCELVLLRFRLARLFEKLVVQCSVVNMMSLAQGPGHHAQGGTILPRLTFLLASPFQSWQK